MELKLLSKAEKKIAIKAELVTGANTRKLATKYDVHYTTVIGYRNELREGNSKDEALAVADVGDVALKVIAENVKAQTIEVLPPKKAEEFNTAVDGLVEGASSLQILDTEFHTTITKLLSWANNQIDDNMDIKTWEKIAYRIGELHKSIFMSGGVQVNVQQNNANNSFSNGMVN